VEARQSLSKGENLKYSDFIEVEINKSCNDLNFLAKAISRDITRPIMQFLQIEESSIKPNLIGIATDGKRMHIVDPLPECGLSIGAWRILKTGSKVWLTKYADNKVNFPTWRKVLPKGKPNYSTTFNGFSITTNATSLTTLIREFPEPTALNLTFVLDLGISDVWDIEYRGPPSAVVFKSNNKTALIMPMNM
jgi:hypothetical protein